jgi:hypothetical protein
MPSALELVVFAGGRAGKAVVRRGRTVNKSDFIVVDDGCIFFDLIDLELLSFRENIS